MTDLTVPWRGEYVRGERPEGGILCTVREGADPDYEVYRDDHAMVVLNIYPYNPGHLLIIPLRHVETLADLRPDERSSFYTLMERGVQLREEVFTPKGFNIGINQGVFSGASIPHLHAHVVPRYPNEMGFMDIAAGTRIQLEPLDTVVEKLRARRDILAGDQGTG